MSQKPKDLDDALDQVDLPEKLSGDQIREVLGLDLLDQAEANPDVIGAAIDIHLRPHMIPESAPRTRSIRNVLTDSPEIHYLPHYTGLPKIAQADTDGLAYDLICAESEGVWINTTGSRMVTVRCGFALLVGSGIAAQIRQVTEMTALGILVVNDDLDSQRLRDEVLVTLVNMSTKTLKIERGQVIARMRLVPILQYSAPFVEAAD